jgi:hypothetical protein
VSIPKETLIRINYTGHSNELFKGFFIPPKVKIKQEESNIFSNDLFVD